MSYDDDDVYSRYNYVDDFPEGIPDNESLDLVDLEVSYQRMLEFIYQYGIDPAIDAMPEELKQRLWGYFKNGE